MDRIISPVKPRVTEILRAVGLSKDFSGISPFYAQRGTACHLALNLYIKGTLDESTLDESYRLHFEGGKKFLLEHPDEYQSEVHKENEDYQGTIDLVSKEAVWDFKCSKAHDRVAEIQGAGYKNLLGVDLPFRVIQLPGDGTYKIIEYKAAIALWDATWRIYCWKMKK